MRRPSIQSSAIHCGICLVLMGALSMLRHEPLLFPAVGGSVCMVLSNPEAEAAAPKNVVVAHRLSGVEYPLWRVREPA